MRVTRESLLRIAKETVQERAYNDPEMIAAYLTGSLLNVDPMRAAPQILTSSLFIRINHSSHANS